MVPTAQNCPFAATQFRVPGPPIFPLQPNHVLLYSLCPCGRHRMHFAIHRNVLLSQIGRNQSISQNARALPHLQRLAEIQLQARFRRIISRKENSQMVLTDSDFEDDVDR